MTNPMYSMYAFPDTHQSQPTPSADVPAHSVTEIVADIQTQSAPQFNGSEARGSWDSAHRPLGHQIANAAFTASRMHDGSVVVQAASR
jgi:hypothetical protein